MKNFLKLICAAFLFAACTDYLDEFKDEYDDTFAAVGDSSSSDDEVSSSEESSEESSSSKKATSSSSEKKDESSSSKKVESSSSAKDKSSSSESTPISAGIFGTCAPDNSAVEMGERVGWTFTWNTKTSGIGSTDMAKASYKWTIDGDDAEVYPGTETTKSASVTYSKFGTRTASVEVLIAQYGSQTIECSSLIVKGSPITGCRCLPINIRPDVSLGESAKWQISGCTSTAKISSYTWTGATADATELVATAPVSSQGEKVTGVSVLVENDENVMLNVSCDEAKAIDSSMPNYTIDEPGDAGAIVFPGSGEYTIIFNLESGWHGGNDTGECTFSCVALGEFSGTIGTVKISGSYHSSAKIPVSSTIGGNSVPFKITTENGASATCKLY